MSPRVLLLALVVAACHAGEAPPAWRPHEHPATVVARITGFTRPVATMTIAAEVTAAVAEVALEAGERVPGEVGASAPVIRLDDRLAAIAVDEAQARQASAALAAAAAAAQVAIVDRERDYQRDELARIADLARDGVVSRQERDRTAHAADTAGLRREAAAADLAAARSAEREAAIAVERAAALRAKHVIAAPSGWIVTRRLVEPGSTALAGQPLIALADVSRLAIDLPLADDELAALRAGGRANVRFVRGGATCTARIARVAVEADAVSRKRLTTLEIAAADAPEAAGGLEAALEVESPDPAGGLLVPTAYVASAYERDLVACADGRRLAITPLRRVDGFVVVPAAALPDAVELVVWGAGDACAP